MQSRFSLFGWGVSLAVHTVLVVILFVAAHRQSTPAPAGDSSATEEPVESERPFPELSEEPKESKRPKELKEPTLRQEAPAVVRDAETAAPEATVVYTVQAGDTLTAIARRTGTTLEGLAKLNKTTVKKLSKLWVGQKIRVPADRK